MDTSVQEGIINIGKYAFRDCIGLQAISIPATVTAINNYAFLSCTSLTTVNMANGLERIDNYAFKDCSQLSHLNLPKSVSSIGDGAFIGCINLSSITVDSDNTTYDSRNQCNALIETATNKLLQGCRNSIIPNGTMIIGDNAFYCCLNLTSINIPNTVTSIGENAFYYCQGLTTIVLPYNITKILPSAFKGCNKITDVYCYATNVPSLGANAFDNVTLSSSILHVPSESLYQYVNSSIWKNFNSIVPLADDDPKPTGIPDVRSNMADVRGIYYDLNGRKLNGEATQKGVYIQNGKKVVMK